MLQDNHGAEEAASQQLADDHVYLCFSVTHWLSSCGEAGPLWRRKPPRRVPVLRWLGWDWSCSGGAVAGPAGAGRCQVGVFPPLLGVVLPLRVVCWPAAVARFPAVVADRAPFAVQLWDTAASPAGNGLAVLRRPRNRGGFAASRGPGRWGTVGRAGPAAVLSLPGSVVRPGPTTPVPTLRPCRFSPAVSPRCQM